MYIYIILNNGYIFFVIFFYLFYDYLKNAFTFAFTDSKRDNILFVYIIHKHN